MANTATLLRSDDRWRPASALAGLREEPKFPALALPGLSAPLPEGLPRGAIVDISGARSSGRTSVCLHALAQATRHGEICAVVDLHNSFCPTSAHAAGIALDRLLWVQCGGNAEHAMRAADLLLHAGGFGLVLLDLCEASPRVLNRIPLSYWHRFRRAVAPTSAILIVSAESPQARSCANVALDLRRASTRWSGTSPFLLRGLATAIVPRRAFTAPKRYLVEAVAPAPGRVA